MNKNQRKIKLKFEDYIDQIDEEIRKRKSKLTLTSIAWMDFDDISQILRIHIYKKWSLFDQDKALGPWLNRIISNQINSKAACFRQISRQNSAKSRCFFTSVTGMYPDST